MTGRKTMATGSTAVSYNIDGIERRRRRPFAEFNLDKDTTSCTECALGWKKVGEERFPDSLFL
jgi:hypothetical protein